MIMELSNGIKSEPQRIVIYGPEGIGKSTLASKLPKPVFIDVEGSTSDLDVMRTPSPSSWRSLVDMAAEFVGNHHGRETLVIDTADWAERLAIAHVCASHNLTSLGGNEDYGKSYNLLETEWCRFLDLLSRVANSGMHVCVTAHAKMRKFELPDQDGAYDRWELKLERKTAPALREWARTVLFLNYKTYVVAGDKKGDSPKAKGGHRLLYTSHSPVWDAKNRVGLSDELPLDYASIAGLFTHSRPVVEAAKPVVATTAVTTAVSATVQPPVVSSPVTPQFLVSLLELMNRDRVSTREIQLAVSKRGYYPVDTPLENYDPQFVAGRLVAYWPKVIEMVNQVRQEVAV